MHQAPGLCFAHGMILHSQLFADTNIHLRCDEVSGFKFLDSAKDVHCVLYLIIILFLVLLFNGYLDALIL